MSKRVARPKVIRAEIIDMGYDATARLRAVYLVGKRSRTRYG
jgi:hypothetical protein